MRIQAVFFDLFETLVSEFADGKRISNRQYDYMQLFGISHEDFKLDWRSHQDARMRGDFATFTDVIQAILASRGLSADEGKIESLYQDRVKEKHIPFEAINADVLEMLQYLKDNKWTCKPDREIYSLACNRMGVQPEACIFVGDGGSNEFAGADDAGLSVFHAKWFNPSIQSDYPELGSPREFIAAMEQLQKRI
jgi:putative hydrolase of the HAD superfamily